MNKIMLNPTPSDSGRGRAAKDAGTMMARGTGAGAAKDAGAMVARGTGAREAKDAGT